MTIIFKSILELDVIKYRNHTKKSNKAIAVCYFLLHLYINAQNNKMYMYNFGCNLLALLTTEVNYKTFSLLFCDITWCQWNNFFINNIYWHILMMHDCRLLLILNKAYMADIIGYILNWNIVNYYTS